jgi:hypothetical protein
VAGDANTALQTYPDQSLYPADSVPKVVERINNAFMRADQIQHAQGKSDIHWFAPIVVSVGCVVRRERAESCWLHPCACLAACGWVPSTQHNKPPRHTKSDPFGLCPLLPLLCLLLPRLMLRLVLAAT